jgi:hypothetical protein
MLTPAIAEDQPQDVTTFRWFTGIITQNGYGNDMYFRLQNGDDDTCTGCSLDSKHFAVRRTNSGLSSSTSASPTTSAATSGDTTSTTTSIVETTRTADAAARPAETNTAAAGQDAPSADTTTSSDSSRNRDVGLGLGLGLGIPLLLAILLALFFFMRRRRRSRQRSSYRPTSSGNWAEDDHQQQPMREAGAPGWSETRQVNPAENPFLSPKYAGSQNSRSSWIEPFEFENPRARNQDEMSQVRQSINGDSASSRSVYWDAESPTTDAGAVFTRSSRPTRRNSDSSFVAGTDITTLSGGLEQPRRAHLSVPPGTAI